MTNSASAGELAAGDVRFSRVWGLHVDQYNNRILTATSRGYVDEFNENNFTVARVNHEFSGTRSSFGGIIVNKSESGTSNYNRVFALDGNLGLGKKAQVFGFISKSSTPGI